jgi:cytochrome P450
MVARDTTRATRLADVEIPADRPVMVFVGAANRDPSRFERPDEFDLHRPMAPHVTFGSGPHVCLGMHLARLETRVALDAVLERLPNLRLDPAAPTPRIQGNVFRSPSALPVLFDGQVSFPAG